MEKKALWNIVTILGVVGFIGIPASHMWEVHQEGERQRQVEQKNTTLRAIDPFTDRIRSLRADIFVDKHDIDLIKRANPDGRTGDLEARVAANERQVNCLFAKLAPYNVAAKNGDLTAFTSGRVTIDLDSCNPS